jgi:RNA polymerase sigma-70 factor (ECF subfamily)
MATPDDKDEATEHEQGETPSTGESQTVVAAVRSGDETAFTALFDRHRRELRVHCYRMIGNLDDAEDLVQETFVRAWRARSSFEGRATVRAWLYRIATNICLDAVKRRRRRVQTVGLTAAGGGGRGPGFDEVPWLQPFPDHLLEEDESRPADPESMVVAKETIELAFMAAIQHLEPRPRAVLILRDVLGWSAAETAEVLGGSVPAVNSALQRARARMQDLGRPGRLDWSPVTPPSEEERLLVQRYMDAHARADADAVIGLLGPDVRFSMPPDLARFDGLVSVAGFFRDLFGEENPGDWRLVPTRANGQPAAANYVRQWGGSTFDAATIDVLQVEHGRIAEITTFFADAFPSFGLPLVLEEGLH